MIIRFLICLLLAGFGSTPLLATAQLQATATLPDPLHIAISNDSFPYMFADDAGQPAGLVVDYWQQLAAVQGISVKFAMADWPETLRLLQDGAVHLHGGIARNAEREQQYQLQQLQQKLQQHQKLQLKSTELKQQLSSTAEALAPVTAQLVTLRQHYKALTEQINDKKQLLAQQQLIMQLSEHRSRLQPEQPCPLCGATEHPAVTAYQQLNSSATEQQLQAKEAELSQTQRQGEELNKRESALQAEQRHLTQQLAQLDTELAELNAEMTYQAEGSSLATITSQLDAIAAELSKNEQQLRQLEQLQQQRQQVKEQQQQLERQLADNQHQLQLWQQQALHLDKQQAELAAQHDHWHQQWQAMQIEIRHVPGGGGVVVTDHRVRVADRHRAELDGARRQVDAIGRRLALRVGAHALCEKPLVLNPWNLDVLQDKFHQPQILRLADARHHLANENEALRKRYFDFLRERLA